MPETGLDLSLKFLPCDCSCSTTAVSLDAVQDGWLGFKALGCSASGFDAMAPLLVELCFCSKVVACMD